MHVTHGFGAFYTPDSKVLILGTMPSPKSREQGFYYAHPQNRFWRVLPRVFDKPDNLVGDIPAQQAFLQAHRIALWDVLAECDIEGASDASIRNPVPNDFAWLLARTQVTHIFTTGSKATALYRRYGLKTVPAQGLPSTSPANCAVSLERLCQSYRVIRDALEQESDGKELL